MDQNLLRLASRALQEANGRGKSLLSANGLGRQSDPQSVPGRVPGRYPTRDRLDRGFAETTRQSQGYVSRLNHQTWPTRISQKGHFLPKSQQTYDFRLVRLSRRDFTEGEHRNY